LRILADKKTKKFLKIRANLLYPCESACYLFQAEWSQISLFICGEFNTLSALFKIENLNKKGKPPYEKNPFY